MWIKYAILAVKYIEFLEVFCKVFFSVNDRVVAQYFTILGV